MSYVRFAIVCEERTGSNFLQRLLCSHPNVICLGELFNPSDTIRGWACQTTKASEEAHPDQGPPSITVDDDPVDYLETRVFRNYPDKIKAVGFRFFYDHARKGVWQNARDYVRIFNGIRIVHLRRDNLLDRYLSHALAKRSNEWIALEDQPEHYNGTVTLDPKHCFESFVLSRWYQDEAAGLFADHPLLDISYEQLCDDLEQQSGRLQEFLSLRHHPLCSDTKKQRHRPKREMISNYDQLKASLADGLKHGWAQPEWRAYFDEE